MKIQSSNKIKPEFNMSSMTDVVFLLLIFFMITSNSIKGLDLQLPKSQSAATVHKTNVYVSIANNGKGFYINDDLVAEGNLEESLKKVMEKTKKKSFILKVQHDVSVQRIVGVMDIAGKNHYKVVLAVKSYKTP